VQLPAVQTTTGQEYCTKLVSIEGTIHRFKEL